MYAISGITSTIASAFTELLPVGAALESVARPWQLTALADKYLILNGLLYAKPRASQSLEEQQASHEANFSTIVTACRRIFDSAPNARIVVLGSESAYRGSFDESYAQSKALLHDFVEREPTRPTQQLVAISPTIIKDTRMTARRRDVDRLQARLERHPKGRFVTAREVATLALFLLDIDAGFITNTVIRMHGGER